MPSFLFFFYYVCVFYNLCEEKNPVLSLVGVFLDNCRHEQKNKTAKRKNLRKQRGVSREKIEEVNFGFKKNSKTSLQLSSRWSGGVVVACAYFIRGKYILTTLIANTHFSTRAFSEREREREKSV